MNVLIIEDNPMVDFIHRNYLEKAALFDSIMSSNSMASAQNILTTYAIDLILLDIHIIDGNGISFLETLRAQHHPCEVIIISAANDGNSIRDGFHLGIIDYLIKPFTFERFQESIQQFVTHREHLANQQLEQAQIDQLKCLTSKKDTKNKQLLEKGLSESTFQWIMENIKAFDQPFTIQELASACHLSHVSVRKYIAYLEENKQLNSQQIFTKVGRPYRVYW
ncbi:Chemotaxis response regulator protein-glutamate methylesterase [Streptococcus dysgalactiae subsp. equisimilis AC-2713]|uniref:Transcriptional regulatory protein n=1 Tax=Streptococcus dysgalactiae subsp. equisimilis AC-2713 TaxID=759913 RepID=A0AB33R7F4_STREQ|nr:response regulator [Streptococcus dysgalactiae]QJD61777.1 response regulator [Streptococcus dysgalactiae subsp. equisimilis]QJD63705.1 response regulator [Streptococcus dysgalactiae subsp. equisimilis]QJR39109.1 response regulator [Streptococcus dysgalactiae subsp. equisimilis]CCI62403.1 Chemotaxis response regulator protein-glutamate methylesterase [Streptococcus dysgalactiae subsp. equisimilis AC-2713]